MWHIVFLAFASVASIGPTNLYAINEGLKKGAHHTFWILTGGVVTDLFYAHLAGIGATFFFSNTKVQIAMTGIGITLFGYFGIKNIINIFLKRQYKTDIINKEPNPFMIGLLMTLPNPFSILMWAAAFVSYKINYTPITLSAIIISVGIFWASIESATVQLLKKHFKQSVYKIVDGVTGIILVVFAIKMALKMFAII